MLEPTLGWSWDFLGLLGILFSRERISLSGILPILVLGLSLGVVLGNELLIGMPLLFLSRRFHWAFPPALCILICLMGLGAEVGQSASVPSARVAGGFFVPVQPPIEGYSLTNAFGSLVFEDPVSIASPPGETNRLFVVERTGQIIVLTNLSDPTRTVFLNLKTNVYADYIEAGLLGLAFHPGYATNGFLYVYRTLFTSSEVGANLLHNQLSRFQVSPTDPNRALDGSELVLISQYDEQSTHNGGDVHFGPDGYLYLSLGDEGPPEHELFFTKQPIDKSLFGGILRIDVDKRPGNLAPNFHPSSTTNYAIPWDNPFIGVSYHHGYPVDLAQVRTEYFAIGFRNPFRMSFDSVTGRLFCGEVGAGTEEEVDIITAGESYGWPYFEGSLNVAAPPLGATFAEPFLTYRHGSANNEGKCVIGGLVCRNGPIPQLEGMYVFGDNVHGHIWAVATEKVGTNQPPLQRLTAEPGVSAFGRDPRDNGLLVVNYHQGRIKRLVYHPAVGDETFPQTLADTRLFSSLLDLDPAPGLTPYSISVPFWSDNAQKRRWFAVPDTNAFIAFAPEVPWTIPSGTIWVKHFDLEMIKGDPASARRLETRLLVKNEQGIYGVTYRWGNSSSNATLVPQEGMDESFAILDNGVTRTQVWHYPSRAECLACHSAAGGYAQGFNTAQLNLDVAYVEGRTNQLTALSRAGYFDRLITNIAVLPALAHATNSHYSVAQRARSYLAVNCAQCHQPDGGYTVGAEWDGRLETRLADMRILGRLLNPHSTATSPLWQLLNYPGNAKMPPIGTSELDTNGIALLGQWISSFPLAPWESADIGGGKREGRPSIQGSVHVIHASGAGVRGTNDSFHFLSQPFSGNLLVMARLTSMFAADSAAKAGLMIRQNSSNGAINASLLADPSGLAAFQFRQAMDGETTSLPASLAPQRPWLKLTRVGDLFSSFESPDATNWIAKGSQFIAMPPDVQAGLAVTAHDDWGHNNATFEDVRLLGIQLSVVGSAGQPVAPATVPLAADVVTQGFVIERVEFFRGEEKLGESTQAPYLFTWLDAPAGQHVLIARASDAVGSSLISQPITVTVEPAPALGKFLTRDSITAGNWLNPYGGEAYVIIGDSTNLPPDITISASGHAQQVWRRNTADSRALQKAQSSGRIAANWNSSSNFTVEIWMGDGALRRLAVYCLDWERDVPRSQTIELIDAATGVVLDTQSVASFSGGQYRTWAVRGHIRLRVTRIAGESAVISGLFLQSHPNELPTVSLIDPAANSTVALPASITLRAAASDPGGRVSKVEFYANDLKLGETFAPPYTFVWSNFFAGDYGIRARVVDDLGAFAESESRQFTASLPTAQGALRSWEDDALGNWKGRYGEEGFIIVNHATNLPDYARIELAGAAPFTFAEATEDEAALERIDGPLRISACWYGEDFTLDLSLVDGRRHLISAYLLDWGGARVVEVELIDPSSGTVMDSNIVSDFVSGAMLTWSVEGHVQLRFNRLQGGNAVVSGIFFDRETNQPPDLQLTNPAHGSLWQAPGILTLGAEASDPDGIRKVQFFADGIHIGETTNAPFLYPWSVWSGNYSVLAKAIDAKGAVSASPAAQISVNLTNAHAEFVGIDTNTQGNWPMTYGREGHLIVEDETNFAGGIQVVVKEMRPFVWATGIFDPRALQYSSRFARTASALVTMTNSVVDIILRDGRYHQLATYHLDWAANDRAQKLSLHDGATGALLDERWVSGFHDGHYLVWNVRGHVTLTATSSNGANALISGVFLDPVPESFDAWRVTQFSPAALRDFNVSGDLGDPDADDSRNLLEYLRGSSPVLSQPGVDLEARMENDRLLVAYTRSSKARYLKVTIELSTDMATWTSGEEQFELLEVEAIGDVERVTCRSAWTVSSQPTRFTRLRVERY